MDIGKVIQIALLAVLALSVVIIIVGMLRAVPRPHKVKAYRYSKKGDGWIERK